MTARKLVAEVIGTGLLVFTIGLVVLDGGFGFAGPIAIASVLAALIYAGMPVSGAHYNPVVSLALLLDRKIGVALTGLYVVAQLIGSTLGAFAASWMIRPAEANPIQLDPARAMVSEAIFTFALVFVVFQVAVTPKTAGNSYFGFAIAAVVLAGATTVGTISGASFNPAVTVGFVLMRFIEPADIWLHLLPQLLGGLSAVLACHALSFRETAASNNS